MTQAPWRQQTLPQVAKRLGIGAPTLRGASRKGEIETSTFNGMQIISPQEEARIARSLGLSRFGRAPADSGEASGN